MRHVLALCSMLSGIASLAVVIYLHDAEVAILLSLFAILFHLYAVSS